jgi:hypothetical protein
VWLRLCGECLCAIKGISDQGSFVNRAMDDQDGPEVAKIFYQKLFAKSKISVHDIPYALDDAVAALRRKGVPPERWATFIHMGA